jgi:hypothetical protein
MGQGMGQRHAIDDRLRGDITTTQLLHTGNSRELGQYDVSNVEIVAFWYRGKRSDARVNAIDARRLLGEGCDKDHFLAFFD